MTKEGKIRREARAHLRNNNWGKGVVLTILLLCVPVFWALLVEFCAYILQVDKGMIASFISVAQNNDAAHFIPALLETFGRAEMLIYTIAVGGFSLLYWFVTLPLGLGTARWCYLAAKGESAGVLEVFYYYNKGWLFFRAVGFSIAYLLRALFFGVLCAVPGIAVLIVASSGIVMRDFAPLAALGLIFGVLLLAFGAVLFCIFMLRYLAAPFAAVEFEDKSVRKCFRISKERMYGFKFSAFVLMLTYVPWLILGFFVVPLLFVLPYFLVGIATFCKWMLYGQVQEEKAEKEQQEGKSITDFIPMSKGI